MIDDGVIKFNFAEFRELDHLPIEEFQELELNRKKLFELNLIGEYLPEKIGFGNISIRKQYSEFQTENPQFLITGTQTGGVKDLDGSHYTRVVNFDLESQSVWCHGPIKASSEALTHAAIYQIAPEVGAIVHIHHKKMWQTMLDQNFPATGKSTPYGTKEMGDEVKNLISKYSAKEIVMSGHEDGVIFIGSDIKAATQNAIELYYKLVD